MAPLLPQATDPLNAPDHSLLHRIVAVDGSAPEQSVIVNPDGSLDYNIKIVATAIDYVVSSSSQLVLADTTGGNVTITLPDATLSLGMILHVKKIVAANTVNIASVAGNIDGGATASIKVQYLCLSFVSDGSNWWII